MNPQNQNQGGPPVGIPILVQNNQPQWREQAPILENDQPARVRLALEYVGMMVFKQMERAAVNDISIEVLQGQKPTTAESNALASAANCLSEYFSGKISTDRWERSRLESFKEKRENETTKSRMPEAATHIRCPNCFEQMSRGARPQANCPICKGSGTVFVVAGPGE